MHYQRINLMNWLGKKNKRVEESLRKGLWSGNWVLDHSQARPGQWRQVMRTRGSILELIQSFPKIKWNGLWPREFLRWPILTWRTEGSPTISLKLRGPRTWNTGPCRRSTIGIRGPGLCTVDCLKSNIAWLLTSSPMGQAKAQRSRPQVPRRAGTIRPSSEAATNGTVGTPSSRRTLRPRASKSP